MRPKKEPVHNIDQAAGLEVPPTSRSHLSINFSRGSETSGGRTIKVTQDRKVGTNALHLNGEAPCRRLAELLLLVQQLQNIMLDDGCRECRNYLS